MKKQKNKTKQSRIFGPRFWARDRDLGVCVGTKRKCLVPHPPSISPDSRHEKPPSPIHSATWWICCRTLGWKSNSTSELQSFISSASRWTKSFNQPAHSESQVSLRAKTTRDCVQARGRSNPESKEPLPRVFGSVVTIRCNQKLDACIILYYDNASLDILTSWQLSFS